MEPTVRSTEGSVRFEGGGGVLPTVGGDTAQIVINDHEVIKRLLGELTAAQQTTLRRTALEQLKAALTIHNAMEENLIYPALQSVAGKKHEAQKLYHETAAADVLVFELDTMLKTGDESTSEATAKSLQGAILEHIDDEESKMLPDLEKHATSDQQQLLTRSVREFRSKIAVGAG